MYPEHSTAEAIEMLRALAHGPTEATHLVVGETGIGKTHLLDAVSGSVSVPTVVVRARPHESPIPLSGVSAAMAAVGQQLLVDFSSRFDLDSWGLDRIFVTAHELLAVVRGFRLSPTLVLIDDIDRMDPVSQEMISIMASRLTGTGIRLVITATALPGDVWQGIDGTVLAPLAPRELAQIGRACAPTAIDEVLHLVLPHAHGNPQVLREHLRSIDELALAGDAGVLLPPRGGDAVASIAQRALRGISDDHRRVLELVSVAPVVQHDAVVALTGQHLVDDLVDSRLLTRRGVHLVVSDPRIRSHVKWSVGLADRRLHHEALAQAHAEHPHLAAWSAHFGDETEDAAAALFEAGALLVEQDEPGPAVEFAERALRKSRDVESHAGLIVRLARGLLRHGLPSAASRYIRAIRPTAVGPEHALAVAGIRTLLLLRTLQEPSAEESSTLVRLHAGRDPVGSARLVALTGWLLLNRWQVDDARRLRRTFDRSVTEPVDVPELTIFDAMLAAFDERPPHVALPPVEVSAEELTARGPQALVMQAEVLMLRERHDEARQLLNVALAQPQCFADVWGDIARRVHAMNELFSGRYRTANAIIASHEVVDWQLQDPSILLYFAAWLAHCDGRDDEALTLLADCLATESTRANLAARAMALQLRGVVHLAAGEPERALEDHRRLAGLDQTHPVSLRHLADHVEASVLTGRFAEARSLAARMESRLAHDP